ncbi:FkbM family methyltransferase [Cytophaga aurantiaca]|uniref:FkbM family methyltransferase n=1 Tax=Cytophaga aurantiaca TaxID=29530 RepID=UPI0003674C38|nr:FkbM family methyltransferase [Cytophaga aurantiaca]
MKKFFKSIYRALPFKKEAFTLLKYVWTPSESIYRHLYFKDVFTVKIDSSKKFKIKHYGFQLENAIFWSGLTEGWEKESIKLWIKLCEDSDVIVDIGANTGVYALVAKTVNPSSRVYAFEPVARVYQKLRENIELNAFDIHAYEQAASNFNGTATIYDTDSEHTYSVTVNKNMFSSETTVVSTTIETITLDAFIKNSKIEKIDLIKIDVETHEAEVLEGYSEFLSVHKPTMLIEILTDEIGEKVEALVKDLNYLYFNIDELGSVRHVTSLSKSDYYNYLFCSPATADKLNLSYTHS